MSSSSVLAKPPGDCCAKYVKHEGTPAGKKIEIAGVPTYISESASAMNEGVKKIILYYSDIFGPFFLNNSLLQDYFADNGYLVLGIDYFFGDSVATHFGKPGFDVLPWAMEHKARADEVAPRWLAGVKEIYGQEARYFSVGYCFGAPYVTDLAATDEVRASAFAHPSLLEENHFKKVTKPLLLLCAEEDFTFSLEARRRAEDILAEKKANYHIRVFSGVSHGFATRADLAVENQRWAKEEAARSVIGWFERF